MSERMIAIVTVPLKPDVELESGKAKILWDGGLDLVAKREGVKAVYWGRQVENRETAMLVIEQSSSDESSNYEPLIEKLKDLLAGPPSIFHVKLPHSSDPNPLAAPMTECISAYFPPSQDEAEYTANFAEFSVESAKLPNVEFTAMIGGWSAETHQHENLGEGVQGKMFAAFIGWPTIEAHMAFRETEGFGKIIGLLRGGTKGIKMWHVDFKQYR